MRKLILVIPFIFFGCVTNTEPAEHNVHTLKVYLYDDFEILNVINSTLVKQENTYHFKGHLKHPAIVIANFKHIKPDTLQLIEVIETLEINR